ncbi:hypothetical protein [Saccharopolyspora spinosa]|uniref:Uncharacterized protein n=1 Tax=Saccharopolyspora spinosa TaxID=60894 RepID=A0A2N3Y438_SACSN|nr:hypothetical protein [Saccharopolyspora spinosa]PKW17664.1 hypothetical protein A8926_5660 [Saccharopolyspora spinosa]
MSSSVKAESARPNFQQGLARVKAGLELQRSRILAWTEAAPQRVPGLMDLRGTPSQDLDYYVYELARLQDLTRAVLRVFDEPEPIKIALAAFDSQIPDLRTIRNQLTHIDGRSRLVNVMWFDSIVELGPNGTVKYLVDPRYRHHDAAIALAAALQDFLEAPAKPES